MNPSLKKTVKRPSSLIGFIIPEDFMPDGPSGVVTRPPNEKPGIARKAKKVLGIGKDSKGSGRGKGKASGDVTKRRGSTPEDNRESNDGENANGITVRVDVWTTVEVVKNDAEDDR